MMKNERKGTSALAALAENLPVRARVGLALIAADIAVSRLEASRHLSEAASAFDVARRWFDGEAVPTDQIQDTLYGEDVSVNEVDERELDEIDKSLWIIAPSAASQLRTAAQYLRTHPDATFRDLKAGISGSPQSPFVGS